MGSSNLCNGKMGRNNIHLLKSLNIKCPIQTWLEYSFHSTNIFPLILYQRNNVVVKHTNIDPGSWSDVLAS